MSDIFISYTREDRPRLQVIASTLEAFGWSVWSDRTIQAGQMYDLVIEEALSEAKCVIVAWSHDSVRSSWVRNEADDARKRGILIPVLIDDVEQPLAFRRVQAADLVGWEGDRDTPEFRKLVGDIAAMIERSTDAAAAPKPVSAGLPPPPKPPMISLAPAPPVVESLPPRPPVGQATGRYRFAGIAIAILAVGLGVWRWVTRQPVSTNLESTTPPVVAMQLSAAGPPPVETVPPPAETEPMSSEDVTLSAVVEQQPTVVEEPPAQTKPASPKTKPPPKSMTPSPSAALPPPHNGTRRLWASIPFRYIRSDDPARRDYWIGETEVTHGQWQDLLGGNPAFYADKSDPRLPVEHITWSDAVRLANRLSERIGFYPCYRLQGRDVSLRRSNCSGFRLPAEAEWAHAARAGRRGRFHTGDFLTSDLANFKSYCGGCTFPGNPGGKRDLPGVPMPVKSFAANPWGLYDIHGNVMEWTWERTARGGGFRSPERECLLTYRLPMGASSKERDLGFRLVRTAD